jgi:hypothetical protein
MPSKLLILASILYLIPLDVFLYIEWINTMINYRWISGAVIFPLFSIVFFCVPTVILIIMNKIDTKYPIKQLCIIAVLNLIYSIIITVTTPYVSIFLGMVFNRLILPLTLLFSHIYLRYRYHKTHYIGIAIIICGIVLSTIPKLLSSQDHTNHISLIFYISAVIPVTFSYIVVEKYMKDFPNSSYLYMNCVILAFQIVFGISTMPLVLAPITDNVSSNNLNTYILNSFRCQFSLTNSEDICKQSFTLMMLYQCANTITELLMFYIIYNSSSVLMIILATLKNSLIPFVGYFLVSYDIVTLTTGESYVISWSYDLVGIIVILIGSVIYAKNKEIIPNLFEPFNDDVL